MRFKFGTLQKNVSKDRTPAEITDLFILIGRIKGGLCSKKNIETFNLKKKTQIK